MSEQYIHEEYSGADLKPSWKQKVLNKLAEFPVADRIGRERAVDLVEKSGVAKYLKPEGTYLDIGTGLGHIVEEMVKERDGIKINMLAVEPTWKPLRRVRSRVKEEAGDRAMYAKADAEYLPVKDKSLDGASFFFVLHHMPTEAMDSVFAEIDRVLKEDGKLFLVEDTPRNEEEYKRNVKWDRRLNFEGKDEPHFYHSPDEWSDILNNYGFELVERVDFDDQSSKKDEGTIRHTSFILQRAVKEQTDNL